MTLPVAEPCGSTTIEYVPVTGSMNDIVPPATPNALGPFRTVESGLNTVTRVVQHTALIVSVCEVADVPLKVSFAFWPGVVVVTVTAAPPGVIVPVTSAGTS